MKHAPRSAETLHCILSSKTVFVPARRGVLLTFTREMVVGRGGGALNLPKHTMNLHLNCAPFNTCALFS